MRKQEQRLWDRLRAKAVAPRVRLERIENLVGVGTPDVIAISRGQVTWIELKAVDAFPAKAATRVLGAKGLNVSQRNWHYNWYAEGGSSLILIGVGPISFYAIPGILADAVNEMSHSDLVKYDIADDWDSLFAYLGVRKI